MQETKDLKNCCPLPKHEEAKEDPECKHHLEGIENKEGKEKYKAYNCYSECTFKNQGLLKDGGVIDKEKLKELTEQHLTKNDAGDFKEIAMNSIDYCIGESEKNYTGNVTESFSWKFSFNSWRQEGKVGQVGSWTEKQDGKREQRRKEVWHVGGWRNRLYDGKHRSRKHIFIFDSFLEISVKVSKALCMILMFFYLQKIYLKFL